MKKSFALGAASGITALAIGFPLATQFANAQDTSSSAGSATVATDKPAFKARAPFSQDDVQKLIDRDNQFLLHIDEFVTIQKEAVQNHRIALQAAADITDETERNDAVRTAHDVMRLEIKEAIEANSDLKDLKVMHYGHGRPGRGPHDLAEILGMTEEELKAALDSGKTPKEIAAEKGITLPPKPPKWGQR